MTALAQPEAMLPSPVSPELILVSPPDVAQLARKLLPDPPQVPRASDPLEPRGPRALLLAGLYLVCLAATIGPLVLTIVINPIAAAS